MNTLLERIGRVFLRLFEQTGLWFRMLWRTITWTFRPPFDLLESTRSAATVAVSIYSMALVASFWVAEPESGQLPD